MLADSHRIANETREEATRSYDASVDAQEIVLNSVAIGFVFELLAENTLAGTQK